MHNDKFDDNALIPSHTKPTNPLRDSTSGPADLLTAYPFPNRLSPYPHSDALDRFSTTSPADNSHGHSARASDKTLSGVPLFWATPTSTLPLRAITLVMLCLTTYPACVHARIRCPGNFPTLDQGGIPCEIFVTSIACPHRSRVAHPT